MCVLQSCHAQIIMTLTDQLMGDITLSQWWGTCRWYLQIPPSRLNVLCTLGTLLVMRTSRRSQVGPHGSVCVHGQMICRTFHTVAVFILVTVVVLMHKLHPL